jgi:uncharacterized protein (TIGR02145 family)
MFKSPGKNYLSSIRVVLFAISLGLFIQGCGEDTPTDSSGGDPQSTVPAVTTTDVTAITTTTAECGGNVTSDGGETVTARGICWSLNSTPTLSDNVTTNGTGTGSFTSSISGLEAETQYYVRAYATNSVGTGYGTARSFTTEATTGTLTDIDGNVYQWVTIGGQIWMAENLKVTHYRNGDPIPNILDGMAWDAYGAGAYCEFDNSPDSAEVWGRLYNWYAVNDSRNIAPEGWHIPTLQEWYNLQSTLGSDAGNKMKEVGDAHWTSPNDLATNESGFTALAAGMRGYQGHYISLYQDAFFWTSTEYDVDDARYASLSHGTISLYLGSRISMRTGCSIRCVKD